MSGRSGPREPTGYELRVVGHVDQSWSAWLGGLVLTHESDGTTTMRGVVVDQAELHGLLAKVRDVGATLLSVVATDGPDVAEREPVRPQNRSRPS